MDTSGYISVLKKFKHIDKDVGDTALVILSHYSERSSASTYEIFKALKSTPSKMAYKNVHKRIQRLKALGFIKLVKAEKEGHAAKYYALTEAGLYQLFLRNKKPSFILRFSWIIDNYGDSAIFDTFLYPYFNKQTLTSIRQPSKTLKIYEIFEDVNFKVLHFIVEYLHVCCRELYSGLKKDYTSNKENHMAYLNSYLHTIVNEFLFYLVLAFGYYEQDIGLSILKTFSQDDKFMREVENVHERFQRSYKIAMDLRKRS
jgi:DNA-binding PadR family transcriptional regulator